MRHAIDENGMSMKLVRHCNESKTFRKEILKLFTTEKKRIAIAAKKIDDIQFTGDNPVGTYNVKPDITIRYKTGEKAYIEVKTNKNTGYQESQTENNVQGETAKENEKVNYIELLKGVNREIVGSEIVGGDEIINGDPDYDKKHFGYLLDKKHYDEFKNSKDSCYPIACWNDVYEKVKDFGYRDFERDIKENVDGVITKQEEIKFTPFDIALLYNPKLIYDMLEKLNNLKSDFLNNSGNENNLEYTLKYYEEVNEVKIEDFVLKDVLDNLLKDNNVLSFKYLFDKDKDYDYLLSTSNNKSIEKMYWGWQTDILERATDFDKKNIKDKDNIKDTKFEDYLYSFSMHKESLNMKKLDDNNIKYLEDEYGWIYFPIKDEYVPKDIDTFIETVFNYKVCNEKEQSRLKKLFVCNYIIFFYKMKELFTKVENDIVDSLNKDLNSDGKNKIKFECPKDNEKWYPEYPGCHCINIKYDNETKPIEKSLCYGFMQNVFDSDYNFTKLGKKNELPIDDCFFSVWFVENTLIEKLGIVQLNKSKFAWEDQYKNLFQPISRMVFCEKRCSEAFTEEVIRIIEHAFGKDFFDIK